MSKKLHRTSTAGWAPVPAAFLDRMAGLLGDEYPAFAASYDAPPRAGLRANLLKLTPAELMRLAPFPLQALPSAEDPSGHAGWLPGAFLTTDDVQPGKHPYHAAGLFYLQDPAAMAPAALLAPQPGDRVLDLAAAPGGKATHLASLLRGTGLLVANEINPQRVYDLAENLERWGARNVAITNEKPERLAEVFPAFFDRVLVDAPCSGEGMLRRSVAARIEWTPSLVEGCAVRQSTILNSAALMVRPGGVLGYVTCTFNPEENEGTVARFLQAHPEFDMLQISAHPGFRSGRPDWLPPSERSAGLARAVRLWPQNFPGEGHFVALLQRRSNGQDAGTRALAEPETAAPRRAQAPRRPGQAGILPPTAAQRALYLAFCRQHLAAIPAEEGLAVTGTYLYRTPAGLPGLSGLRYIHPGWWLGEFKKDRFEPSHALALALSAADAQRVMEVDPEGAPVHAYLRGETVVSAGEDGWVLVTVSGYPLGWGKRVHGVVKSHYPRGLRRY